MQPTCRNCDHVANLHSAISGACTVNRCTCQQYVSRGAQMGSQSVSGGVSEGRKEDMVTDIPSESDSIAKALDHDEDLIQIRQNIDSAKLSGKDETSNVKEEIKPAKPVTLCGNCGEEIFYGIDFSNQLATRGGVRTWFHEATRQNTCEKDDDRAVRPIAYPMGAHYGF